MGAPVARIGHRRERRAMHLVLASDVAAIAVRWAVRSAALYRTISRCCSQRRWAKRETHANLDPLLIPRCNSRRLRLGAAAGAPRWRRDSAAPAFQFPVGEPRGRRGTAG